MTRPPFEHPVVQRGSRIFGVLYELFRLTAERMLGLGIAVLTFIGLLVVLGVPNLNVSMLDQLVMSQGVGFKAAVLLALTVQVLLMWWHRAGRKNSEQDIYLLSLPILALLNSGHGQTLGDLVLYLGFYTFSFSAFGVLVRRFKAAQPVTEAGGRG